MLQTAVNGVVHLFPGQGSQRVGMGDGLFASYAGLVRQADRVLGYSVEELCLGGQDERLGQTQYTQPALFVVDVLHALDCQARHDDQVVARAGHSLGEFAALHLAGAFDFETGVAIVRTRGLLMASAPPGAMAAITRVPPDVVAAVLADLGAPDLQIANVNSPDQCVVSGPRDQVLSDATARAFERAGAKHVPLKVSGAFHSRQMAGAQEDFGEFLESVDMGELAGTVISNVTAAPFPRSGFRDLMTRQLTSPVRWAESVGGLLDAGHTRFVEQGPGKVLTRLLSQIQAHQAA